MTNETQNGLHSGFAPAAVERCDIFREKMKTSAWSARAWQRRFLGRALRLCVSPTITANNRNRQIQLPPMQYGLLAMRGRAASMRKGSAGPVIIIKCC